MRLRSVEKSTAHDPIVGATIAVATCTFFLAVVAYLQWRTLQETNRISQASLRPALGLVNKNSYPEFVPVSGQLGEGGLGRLVWTWEFTNFGRGMAIDVTIDGYIKLEDGPFQYPFDKRGPARWGDMAPGAVSFATISSEPMVNSYGEQLLEQDFGVSYLIIFSYKDDLGKTYKNKFCVSRYQNGAMPYLDAKGCEGQIRTRPQ